MTYINKLFNLEAKVAVIIGGGGHICSKMAKSFARAGCAVAILDIRLDKAQTVENELRTEGLDLIISHKIDVEKKEEYVTALEKVLYKFNQVDILINGAGINSPTPFLKITEEEWDRILAVNLKGTLFGCQVFGRQMLEQGSGSIINISSASSGPPLSKAFSYSVSKAGIRNLTQNLAREWATQGVRVNAIRPGFFPTDWNKEHFITPEREKAILGHTPMGRYGSPKELVGAVLWLGSDAASFVTGAEITVDGGFSAMTI
jgi:NAD(P)-dependent dehydrogenase (short-subunit alcohol dehydrogenase family)